MSSLCPALGYLGCGSESRLLGISVRSQLRIRLLNSWLIWCLVALLGVMDDGQTVSLSLAELRLSLAFNKAVSLVQISCLRLLKKMLNASLG